MDIVCMFASICPVVGDIQCVVNLVTKTWSTRAYAAPPSMCSMCKVFVRRIVICTKKPQSVNKQRLVSTAFTAQNATSGLSCG